MTHLSRSEHPGEKCILDFSKNLRLGLNENRGCFSPVADILLPVTTFLLISEKYQGPQETPGPTFPPKCLLNKASTISLWRLFMLPRPSWRKTRSSVITRPRRLAQGVFPHPSALKPRKPTGPSSLNRSLQGSDPEEQAELLHPSTRPRFRSAGQSRCPGKCRLRRVLG